MSEEHMASRVLAQGGQRQAETDGRSATEARIAALVAELNNTACTERLRLMKQNPADYHFWSKPVGPLLYPFEIAVYLQAGLDAVAAGRSALRKAAELGRGKNG